MSKNIQTKIAEAKALLKANGFFTDNLWHIQDVTWRYKCVDKAMAYYILNKALTNEATMQQIWLAIDMEAEMQGYEEQEEDENQIKSY